MPRKPIKNGLQRRQFGRGERRLRGNELTSYLAMANFEDLTKRLEATENYRQSQILTGCLLRRSGPR